MSNLSRIMVTFILITFVFAGCHSSEATATPTPSNPTIQPPSMPATPIVEPSVKEIKLEVIYFHRVQRCATCLCFEERINSVIETCFSSEIKDGTMTYQVLSMGDSKNNELMNKYGAVGSQLFINTIVDGKENIKDIQEIWDWNCLRDKQGFDDKVKNVIEQSLKGQVQ